KKLKEAAVLLTNGHRDVAHILTWSAAEAAMRLILEENQIVLQNGAPAELIKLLYSYALISKSEYQVLRDASASRNALAHGLIPKTGRRLNTQPLLRVARRLSQQLHASARS